MALLLVGALAWGARLGDFNMFHVFFGGIAVFAMPAAAIAALDLWERARDKGRGGLAVAILILITIQLEIGVVAGVFRLYKFGPNDYEPIPIALLEAINRLPSGAKLAYSCQPSEEISVWESRLISVDAHTGRRMIPMCFQSEFFGALTGTAISRNVPSPLFAQAPQRRLYPDADARPSSAAVRRFVREHDIHYIYSDTMHPNALVPDAITIARFGTAELLRVP